ncbi:MAG TPA: bifunctional homocysteine S-methyltransferase/methylenetetrahydrofolate reductase [Candidatus Limnocylindrales bacterium]|nr:bifunctional homocysteine S-methyltransferase/methylenetetrahydrofolate reductase [Candidatus Limnocylindrales bacterium]
MRIDDLNARLQAGILIADGAMGSMLHETAGPQRCFEELNATHAESVFRVHRAYIEAGAQLIETNTFGANRLKLAGSGLGDQVTRINHAGVKIAREAREGAAHEVLIAGSIGPSGVSRHMADVSPEELRAAFREQAQALEERGVDLFLLETFTDLDELLSAVEELRAFSKLPIVAQMTFNEEGAATGGVRPVVAAAKLAALNIQVIGTNCTLGPQSLIPIVEELALGTGAIPRSAMPNVGFPRRMGDRTVYPRSSPEYFATFAREAAALGARIIGGCCGTTPEHIRAIAEAVKKLAPAQKVRSAAVAKVAAVAAPQHAAAREPESGIWKKIQARKFVVSVEIDPPKGIALDRIYEQVTNILSSGHVDAIDINSGAMARVGMDALMVAGGLEARGVETIPHLTTRDLNIIGLQAMLLGAWTVGGVRNVLSVTGDPPSVGDYPEVSGVFEVDSIGLVKVLSKLNQGMDWTGKTLGGATNFTIGVAVNPVAEDLDYEIERFHQKIEAGAHFAMTQPIFDPGHWHAFLKKLGGPCPIPVLVGIWPLTSYKQAQRLNNEVPGIVIPEPLLKEMEAAGASAREHGFLLAKRMLEWARSELAGTYLIAPFKRYEEILEIFS